MKQTKLHRWMALFLAVLLLATPLSSGFTASAADIPFGTTAPPPEDSSETSETFDVSEDDPPVLFPENDYVPQDISVFDTFDVSDRMAFYAAIPSFHATSQVTNGTSTSGYRSFNGFRCFGIRNGQLWDRWAGNSGSSGSYGRVAGKIVQFFDEENGGIAYCIQPSLTHANGSQYSKIWSDDLDIEYVKADPYKRQGVTRALIYGAPNNGKRDFDSVVGTHLLVLDVMCGYVDENLESRQGQQTHNNCGAVPAPFWYHQGTAAEKAAYDEIVTTYRNRASHNYIPSFCSQSSGSSVHTLKKDGSQYSITLTDGNGVLADYNFSSNIPGVSFSRNGNQLTITATADAAKQLKDNPVDFQATGKYYQIDDGPYGDIRLYAASSSTQHMAMLAEGHKDAVPAYFRLTADVITEQKFSLYKGINASQTCIDQIKDNAMYSLSGAEYEVLMDGVQQEVLVTDASGYAASGKAYPVGTTLQIREIKAPSGFQLDKRTYSLTIQDGDNRIDVSDIPVFDPPFAITKVDKNNTKPQGNSSFYNAIFKWEYYDNTGWSGSPKRTWYFRTNANGYSIYDFAFLAPGYTSDPLYVNSSGASQIPIGTVTITEIENPLGYLVVPKPLKCSIIEDESSPFGATVDWTKDSLDYILDAKEGNFHIIEEIDTTLFGFLELEKIDADTGTTPQGDATLNGAKYEVINHSENPVMIDGRKYMPGEICFEFTTDEHGHFKSDKIFPLGQYVVREAVPPLGYTLATSSTVHEALPSSAPENNLLKAAHALMETADARMSGKWVHDSKGWWYQFEDGSYPKDRFESIEGFWYYFDPSGYMVTGWKEIKGTWYYFDQSGHMMTGWLWDNSHWFYLDSNGHMAVGWKQIDDNWYYFNDLGYMQTGWQNIKGNWFYLTYSGRMMTGWLWLDPYWYYLDSNGYMQTGHQDINGTGYDFDDKGHLTQKMWTQTFEITKDHAEQSFTAANGNACPNVPIKGGIRIIKQDQDLGDTTPADAPLDGIKFEIANASANPVIVNGSTFANGEIVMTLSIAWDGTQWSASTGAADLPYGTYTVKEVEAKPGMANDYYQYDPTVHTVEIREQDVVVEAIHQNPIAPGKIEIQKVDPLGKPLAGAKFCLEWSEDGSTWQPVSYSDAGITKGGCTSPNLVDGCLVSGADGLVAFEGLYPSIQYRLTEVEAPDGYVLLTKPAFEGLLPVENLTVTLTVHNSPGFTFPTTGTNSMQRMVLIGTLITLISGAMLVYPIRKRHT